MEDCYNKSLSTNFLIEQGYNSDCYNMRFQIECVVQINERRKHSFGMILCLSDLSLSGWYQSCFIKYLKKFVNPFFLNGGLE